MDINLNPDAGVVAARAAAFRSGGEPSVVVDASAARSLEHALYGLAHGLSLLPLRHSGVLTRLAADRRVIEDTTPQRRRYMTAGLAGLGLWYSLGPVGIEVLVEAEWRGLSLRVTARHAAHDRLRAIEAVIAEIDRPPRVAPERIRAELVGPRARVRAIAEGDREQRFVSIVLEGTPGGVVHVSGVGPRREEP